MTNEKKIDRRINKLNKKIERLEDHLLHDMNQYDEILLLSSVTFFSVPIICYGVFCMLNRELAEIDDTIYWIVAGLVAASPFLRECFKDKPDCYKKEIVNYINELHGYALEDNRKFDEENQKIKQKIKDDLFNNPSIIETHGKRIEIRS